jgi:hypothetical protein
MRWNEILPVVLSMVVVVLVAVLEKQSKFFAAIAATVPLTIPLALWIVYSSSQGERGAVEQFSQSLALGMVPTVAFTIALWLGAKAGLKLVPLILTGYAAWGGVLLILISLRRWLGF